MYIWNTTLNFNSDLQSTVIGILVHWNIYNIWYNDLQGSEGGGCTARPCNPHQCMAALEIGCSLCSQVPSSHRRVLSVMEYAKCFVKILSPSIFNWLLVFFTFKDHENFKSEPNMQSSYYIGSLSSVRSVWC